MKKESTEQTMAGSSGSFSAPMGFVTKKEIYKVHNKKKYNENDQLNESVKEISNKYGLPFKEVEKLVIKEIKRIFI